jgi:hypothetical protein
MDAQNLPENFAEEPRGLGEGDRSLSDPEEDLR